MGEEVNNPTVILNPQVIDKAIDFLKLNVNEPSEGIVINQGSTILNPDFNEFDTHVYMCYEYSNCQLLEPTSNNNNELYGCLVCREMEEELEEGQNLDTN